MEGSTVAYRLAWQDEQGFRTSRYGYLDPNAAERAAPTLNRIRVARVHPAYTHVIAFAQGRCVDVRPLEAR